MKQRFINYLLHKVLNFVTIDDVIRTDNKNQMYIGNDIIGDVTLRNLVSEAKALESMYLWKIINETVKRDALNRGWNNSKSIDDLNAGKTMYYTLDLQDSIIKAIKSRENK